ncbi:LEAF RUST 10 DISEASE-RESISTANCE LOCUS RECEPTOR-LIKE PROTEIN KINASE-like 2.5, partial [Bienertia sinuspersici]
MIGILIVLVIYLKKRSHMKFTNFRKGDGKKYQNIDAFLKIYGFLAPKRYTYSMIRKITNGFSEKLGEGGYAVVYKGKLDDGRRLAVKLLKQSKGTGEDFINEVASISRTNHVNIVALLGFCFEGNKKALEKFVYHGGRSHALPLETLFSIGVGIATGLDYLHRGPGLCPQQESTISTMETARGTIGDIAPEVFCRTFGGVSHKSDVYSYGMMILDIVCGRKNIISDEMQHSSELHFPQWIYKRLQHGEVGILNDQEKALERKMILVSLWCIQTYPSNRPSMTQVIEMLQDDVELLTMPPEPNLCSPPASTYNSSETISLVGWKS